MQTRASEPEDPRFTTNLLEPLLAGLDVDTGNLHPLFGDLSRWAFCSSLARLCRAWHLAVAAHRREVTELDFGRDDNEFIGGPFGQDARHVLAELAEHSAALAERAVQSFASQCPNLYVLSLSGRHHVNNECMRTIAQHCPNLCHLDIEDCSVNACGMVAVARSCVELEHLYVEGAKFDSAGSKELVEAARTGVFTKLTDLHLARCDGLSYEAVESIVSHAPHLEGLDLSGKYASVDDDTLVCISKHSQRLQRLVLDGCFGSDGILALANCAALEELHMNAECLANPRFDRFLLIVQAMHQLTTAHPRLRLTVPARFAHAGARISPSPKEALTQLSPKVQIRAVKYDELLGETIEVTHANDVFGNQVEKDPPGHKGLDGVSLVEFLQQEAVKKPATNKKKAKKPKAE